jgi:parvulin-like peptidyl-prolyl isomerase
MKTLEKKFRIEDRAEIGDNELLWIKTEALNQLIQNKLFQIEIDRENIVVSQDELQETLQVTKTGHQEENFKRFLEIEGISAQEWENKLKFNMLIKKLIQRVVNSKVSVSDKEMKDYFESHSDEFHRGERVRALHILVENEEEALRIKKLSRSKRNDFAELARKYSVAPEGVNGGDLGYMEPGHMPLELEAVFKLNVNQVSEVIQTPYGSHLFKVVDKVKDRMMSFDESQKIIHAKLLAEKQDTAFNSWVNNLKSNARIEIDDTVLAKIS